MSRLELNAIEKRYGDLPVLPPVTVHLEPGEALGLWGPTGCGKTTLLRIVAGLLEPTSGTLRIDGEPANTPTPVLAPVKRRIGMVFQDLALWPHMSARRHIEYVLAATIKDRAARRDRAAALLEAVHLREHESKRPAALSRGQRQRLAIARALCNDPAILLLDEPVSSQDAGMADRMAALFQQQRDQGKVLLVASHNRAFLKALCDRVLIFDDRAVNCLDAAGLGDA